ncbi:hypothetical protein BCV69DRAFT_111205 [Microstroma glucosiphilum]|uniref:Uncharacterized protein n=1 Tax=Pseudomicrostroma glucosiphilum TaxID=1684307 RepID=A0A316UD84_9BASI|nr:hypothetical protein BCV69DRAFT_111205 [Pseudomicrostroma glucosiphilum]PWN23180.1 hypothetical protein BCV69DRAFT_111205 [Pseudomicrostroma glucosiphilum]
MQYPALSGVSGAAGSSIPGTAKVNSQRYEAAQHCIRGTILRAAAFARPHKETTLASLTLITQQSRLRSPLTAEAYIPCLSCRWSQSKAAFDATIGQSYGRRIANHPDHLPHRPLHSSHSAKMVVHRARTPACLSLLIPSLLLLYICLPTATAINWMSTPELIKDLTVYQSFVAATVGLQLWESIISFPFEWRYLTRQRRWKHGMAAYLIIRYGTWVHLICVLINIHATHHIDCEATMIVLLVSLSLATLATSLIFVVRCIAVWKRNKCISYGLGALWLATAAVHLSSPARLKSLWSPTGCQSVFVRPMWEYNMAYVTIQILDTTTFGLSAWRLRTMRTQGFAKVLFAQACVFIGITATLNCACMVLAYISPNPVLTYFISPIALTVSGVLACRSFRDLQAHAQRAGTIVTGSGRAYTGGASIQPPSPDSSVAPYSASTKEAFDLDAAKGRALGRRRRSDWLTRTGFDDDEDPIELPTLPMAAAHAPDNADGITQHPGRTSTRQRRTSATPRTSSNLDAKGSTTAFHGFLLPEEEEEHRLDALAAKHQQSLAARQNAARSMTSTSLPLPGNDESDHTIRARNVVASEQTQHVPQLQSPRKQNGPHTFIDMRGMRTENDIGPGPVPRPGTRKARIDDGTPRKEKRTVDGTLFTDETVTTASKPNSIKTQHIRAAGEYASPNAVSGFSSKRSSGLSGDSSDAHAIDIDSIEDGKDSRSVAVGITCHREVHIDG